MVEKSQVAKHMKALRKLWDALPADRFLDAGGKADLWVDCSCLQDVLTVTWLAAWSGMVTAGDQAAAAAR